VPQQYSLDRFRAKVLAVDAEPVAEPSGEVAESVGVRVREITGVVPAVA
jgi:hypothetical protein